MIISDIMTRDAETIQARDSVLHASTRMRDLNVGAIPVLEGDVPVGMVTDRDIVIRTVAEGLNPSTVSVGTIMSKGLIACREDTDLDEAASIMEKNQIRRLVVTDSQGKIVGIVSLGDIAVSTQEELTGEILKEVSVPAEPVR